MYDFGELLKQLRLKRKYSQAQLASKLSKSKSSICKYESNQKTPTLETMINISRLFNVSLDTLAGLEKKETASLDGLTPEQIDIINTLLIEFYDKKKFDRKELSKRQLELMNSIIVELLHLR